MAGGAPDDVKCPNSWVAHIVPSGAQYTPIPTVSNAEANRFSRCPSDFIQATWSVPAVTVEPRPQAMFSPTRLKRPSNNLVMSE